MHDGVRKNVAFSPFFFFVLVRIAFHVPFRIVLVRIVVRVLFHVLRLSLVPESVQIYVVYECLERVYEKS